MTRAFYITTEQHENDNTEPHFHVHIDAQCEIPHHAIKALYAIGFVSDNFAHEYVLKGKNGDPNAPFDHYEPMDHMTFKTAEPEAVYAVWNKAQRILKATQVLRCEEAIASGIRRDHTHLALWERTNIILQALKNSFLDEDLNYKQSPSLSIETTIEETTALFISLQLIAHAPPSNSWQALLEAIYQPMPLPYYLEGEIICFDKQLRSKPFDENAYHRWLPEVAGNHPFANYFVNNNQERESHARALIWHAEKRPLHAHERFRTGEIHLTVRREGCDPRVLQLLGALGFSTPAIPKYIQAANGNGLVAGRDAAPIVVHDLPFTIQARSMPSLRLLANAIVTILEDIGGFNLATIKVEPILIAEIYCDRNHIPPILVEETFQLRADVIEQLQSGGESFAVGHKADISGPIGRWHYDPTLPKYFAKNIVRAKRQFDAHLESERSAVIFTGDEAL